MSILGHLSRRESSMLALALALAILASAVVGVRSNDGSAARPQAAGTLSDGILEEGPVGAVMTTGPTDILAEPRAGAQVASRLRAGILVPVSGLRDGYYAILTPCQRSGWLPADSVETHKVAAPDPPDLADATIVLDPGHGGQQPGAVGPNGLPEAEVNLDVMRQVADLLSAPRSIDPISGAVTPGETFGVPRVFLTHSAYTAGLRYRTDLANALRAHAFVSLHHNAEPDGAHEGPGTETYYQIDSAPSKRLAGLIYEEIVRTLRVHDIPWVGDFDAGAKYRPGSRGDYYAVLRETEIPATLVEAAFVSNPPEEALLRRPQVREQLAHALYRAIARYFTTTDPGSGFTEPYPRGTGGPSGGLPSTCVDPV